METDKLVDFDHVTDYISREAAVEAVRYYKVSGGTNFLYDEAYNDGIDTAISCIGNEVPPADVKPVVRGKWKHDGSDWKNRFICDQCGYKWFFEAEEAHFCPNCGCAMENEK